MQPKTDTRPKTSTRTSRSYLATHQSQLRFQLHRHRRLLAGILGAIALLMAIAAARPAPTETVRILLAAKPIPAGHTITQDDLELTNWPIGLGAQESYFTAEDQAVGRMAAGPVEAGEPLNSGRIVGPSLLDNSLLGTATTTGQTSDESNSESANKVAAIVRLADRANLALARPGDFVDILAADSQTIGDFGRDETTKKAATIPQAIRLAQGARVLAIPGNESESGLGAAVGLNSQNTEAFVVVAVDQETATALAGAATRYRLSMVVSPNPTAATSANSSAASPTANPTVNPSRP